MDVNGDNSNQGGAVLSDAQLIRIIHTFFELTNWKMSCNDMLTKIFYSLKGSIARGLFEDIFRGFLEFLDNGNKKYRRKSKDLTYVEFQVIMAGLIKRFANSNTLKQVMDSDQGSVSSHCPMTVYNLQLNSNTLSLIDSSPCLGIKLIAPKRASVISPKQGALLAFLFTKYYSHNSTIENSAVCSFLEILEQIDEAMFGSAEVQGPRMDNRSHTTNTSIKDHLLSTYGQEDKVIELYIRGEYTKIFEMLNTCFRQYDFLMTGPSNSNKKLLMYYVAAVLSMQSEPDEFSIWALEVSKLGIVGTVHEISVPDNDTDIDHEKCCDTILISLMLLDAESPSPEGSNMKLYKEKMTTITQLLTLELYSDQNPYDKSVTMKDPRKIPSLKLQKLQSLYLRLNPPLTA